MSFKFSKTVLTVLIAVFLLSAAGITRADDDDEHEGRSRNRRGTPTFEVVDNAAYQQECSSCHFLYLPALLPAQSWSNIITKSDKHFGENLALDEATAKELEAYLTANSMENSKARLAAKMLSSLGSDTPARITEIPYIKKEHRKIKESVFKRPSILSFSNCVACHTSAPKGDFDEDSVKIPK